MSWRDDFKKKFPILHADDFDAFLYVEKFISDLLKTKIKEIEKCRDEVSKRHGTHKYDSCYSDCIEILKK